MSGKYITRLIYISFLFSMSFFLESCERVYLIFSSFGSMCACVCVCVLDLLAQMNETYQHPGKWHDIMLTPTPIRSSENHYVMSHVIRGLEQNSVYEAIVQAKNRYGWNEVNNKLKILSSFIFNTILVYTYFFYLRIFVVSFHEKFSCFFLLSFPNIFFSR